MQKNNPRLHPLAIWAITPRGRELGLKIKAAFKDSTLFIPEGADNGMGHEKNIVILKKLSMDIRRCFKNYSGHVFIFSTGIAVRMIAPLLESKMTDPAVVVLDENGNHAISLVSGHLGGANALACEIAAVIKARPVITTATDINGLPAIDLIAKKNRLFIETPHHIKRINMAFLTGTPIDLHDPFGFIQNELPDAIKKPGFIHDQRVEKIFCSHEIRPVSRGTMILRPPVLSVGIGCNRGTRVEDIYEFLGAVMEKERLSIYSVDGLATIDVKKDEKGLTALAEKMNLPMAYYSRETLNSVQAVQSPSDVVEKHMGVKNVCEAAAILSAHNGNLIVAKKKNKDVTIAVAIRK